MIFRETRDKRPQCPSYLGIANDTHPTYLPVRFLPTSKLCGNNSILTHAELSRAGLDLSP